MSSSIARRLEQLILDGTLKLGKKIPSERQLSERLGVSRSILREALKELRGRGLIETRHGQGTIVTGLVSRLEPEHPLVYLFQDHPRTLYDLLEVRELLEGQAAYMAASRGTEEDFRRITRAFNDIDQAQVSSTEAQEAARLDHAFHQSICEASHNPVLVHTLQSLMQLMLNTVLASVNNLYHRAPYKEQIDRHHRQIYNAVIGRRPEWARKAATAHIKNIRERMLELEHEGQRLDRSGVWERTLAGTDSTKPDH
ncbi:transcriptional regulator GlcC [Oceanimonas smirnovii]|uniref:transcriptional regulator GlcC n=1 Tax=Oceanimonas smirnovii TaxID=264574 RepID=UPI003AAB6B27